MDLKLPVMHIINRHTVIQTINYNVQIRKSYETNIILAELQELGYAGFYIAY